MSNINDIRLNYGGKLKINNPRGYALEITVAQDGFTIEATQEYGDLTQSSNAMIQKLMAKQAECISLTDGSNSIAASAIRADRVIGDGDIK